MIEPEGGSTFWIRKRGLGSERLGVLIHYSTQQKDLEEIPALTSYQFPRGSMYSYVICFGFKLFSICFFFFFFFFFFSGPGPSI